MSTAIATREQDAAGDIMESVIAKGDLSKLTPGERATYYAEVCRSMGLNPTTQPFQYITLNGKLVLYAARTAADQLRKIHGVSIRRIEREVFDGVLMVTAYASDASGREDTEIGAVSIAGLKGDALANAHMKALTKAKRRVTLSLCGLGFLDETEVETIPGARPVRVTEHGEIVEQPPPTVIERRPQQSSPQRERSDQERAMAHIHAAANDKGLSDDDLHRITVGEGKSLKDASAQMLDDWAHWIKDAPDDDVGAALERGSTAEDARSMDPEEDLIAAISAATTGAELTRLHTKASNDGMLSEAVKHAGADRRDQLKRARQQGGGELDGMPPANDPDRYTA